MRYLWRAVNFIVSAHFAKEGTGGAALMRLQLERYLIITVDVNGVDRRIVRRAKFFEPQTGWNGVLKELLSAP